jgi:hypothetical protein
MIPVTAAAAAALCRLSLLLFGLEKLEGLL